LICDRIVTPVWNHLKGEGSRQGSIFAPFDRKHCGFRAVLQRKEAIMSKIREKAEAQTE